MRSKCLKRNGNMTGIFADKICRYHHDVWKLMRFSKCKENITYGRLRGVGKFLAKTFGIK